MEVFSTQQVSLANMRPHCRSRNRSTQLAEADFCQVFLLPPFQFLVFKTGWDLRNPLNPKIATLAFLLIFALPIASFDALAVGFGNPQIQSHIGQPLKVMIPLENVDSPDRLQVKIDTQNSTPFQTQKLTASLTKEGSQSMINVHSVDVINEPFVNFSLTLTKEGNRYTKQFSLLLDLLPNDSRQKRHVPDLAMSATQTDSKKSVMGPYDWAENGAIPKKFGAVLNGQSLWRVARRISPAMGVTNDQMMWALYRANTSAFTAQRIESLKAGVYLDIPSVEEVSRVTDARAKQLLKNLSLIESNPSTERRGDVDDKTFNRDTSMLPSSANEGVESRAELLEQFQLGGIDSEMIDAADVSGLDGKRSTEIIQSLSATISSMSDQLGRKDQEIEVLEAKVRELQSFIKNNALQDPDTPSTVESDSTQPMFSTAPKLVSDGGGTHSLTDNNESNWWNHKYVWGLLVILGLLLLLVLLRVPLLRIWQSLALSGRNNSEFDRALFDEPMSFEIDRVDETDQGKDGSEQTESISETIYTDLKAEGYDSEIVYDEPFSVEYLSTTAEDGFVEEEHEFEQRFATLISAGDLDMARQLLDIAHGQDVDSERYHFHRLQLLALANEEDAFYEYYYSIESDIPHFVSAVQTDISKLVVELAKH